MDLESEKNYLREFWKNNSLRKVSSILKKQNIELYNLIKALPDGNNISEKVWIILNGNPPSCITCQNPVRFLDFRRGYTTFCSSKCVANNSDMIKSKADNYFKKHGVSHQFYNPLYREKFLKTMRSKYGVENAGQITELKVKRAKAKRDTNYNSFEKFSEFSKPEFSIDEYTRHDDSELKWRCQICNSIFQSKISYGPPKCKSCFPVGNFGQQSSIEIEIINSIKEFYTGEIIENSRNIIAPKELDIYFPDLKFAIEVNGNYWHNANLLDSNYHQDKFEICKNQNIKLLMISDYEWANYKSLILNMIKHRLGIIRERIHTRKCTIKQITVSNARVFLNINHLHGFVNSSSYIGLFHQDELVSVCSFSIKNRFNNKNEIEITRLAFSYVVPGALGKFLKYIQTFYPALDIITYADLRYGTGDIYRNNGFIMERCTKPGYWYIVNNKIYHRLSWTKKKLINMGYEKTLTEQEIMKQMGALKIYDCGHYVYRLPAR